MLFVPYLVPHVSTTKIDINRKKILLGIWYANDIAIAIGTLLL